MTLTPNIPITATPRTMSNVAMRRPASVAAFIRCPSRKPGTSDIGSGRGFKPCGGSFLGGLRLQLDVILQPHSADHLELCLEEVDMLLLAGQDGFEQFAADIVAHRLAM